MTQPAFYFDASTCIGCKACELACKEKNNLPGGISWRQIYDYGGGEWVRDGEHLVPEGMFTYHVSAACMHCQNPTCVEACGDDALTKQADGLVIIDADKCTGCRKCEPACPYDAIHFDAQKGVATKCDFCADLLAVGEKPACVTICPQRCLDSGDFDELKKQYGSINTIQPLPDGAITQPALVVIPHKATQQNLTDKGQILNRYEKNKASSARVSQRWQSAYDPLIPNNPDWLSTLKGETLLLSLLAKGLHDYPTRQWLQSLLDEQIFSDVPFAAKQADVINGLNQLQNWSDFNQQGVTNNHYEELMVDYTQLFTISFGTAYTPPWESVYCNENQLLFQEQTLQVRSWYRHYGLKYEKIYQEPDDHIALELSFVGHLANIAYEQLRNNDVQNFYSTITAQRNFLSEHLLRWGHHWSEKVIVSARTEFFRGLGLLTRGSLCELAQVLEMKLPKRLSTPFSTTSLRDADKIKTSRL